MYHSFFLIWEIILKQLFIVTTDFFAGWTNTTTNSKIMSMYSSCDFALNHVTNNEFDMINIINQNIFYSLSKKVIATNNISTCL